MDSKKELELGRSEGGYILTLSACTAFVSFISETASNGDVSSWVDGSGSESASSLDSVSDEEREDVIEPVRSAGAAREEPAGERAAVGTSASFGQKAAAMREAAATAGCFVYSWCKLLHLLTCLTLINLWFSYCEQTHFFRSL